MKSEVSIPPSILDEAAAWLVQLQCGEYSAADREACTQWRLRSHEHALAWERAERLLARLDVVPVELAMPVLGRDRGQGRRRALKHLALLLGAAPLAWSAWRETPVLLADRRTGVGELNESRLPDGSLLTLNTDTAVDLRFNAERRHLRLLQGELLLDVRREARPFRVELVHGTLLTEGARFSLRDVGVVARLVVLEGAVQLVPREGQRVQVGARQQGSFDRLGAGPLHVVDSAAVSWSHGMLMVDRMPLGEFAAELGRYRRGVLRVAPQLASLPVSGSFPLRDRERSLAMLEATYPLRVRRLTDYWVSLEPKGA
ncbi:MAG: FecR domain-containing protein [Pseudomonas sp.]